VPREEDLSFCAVEPATFSSSSFLINSSFDLSLSYLAVGSTNLSASLAGLASLSAAAFLTILRCTELSFLFASIGGAQHPSSTYFFP